jgi:hypothetical protein
MTKQAVSSGNAFDLCSGGVRFESSSSAAAAKEPFLNESLPHKMLPHCIRSTFLWISKQ